MAERTHDPTPKRLRDARDKGDVPYGPLVAAALGMFVLPALGRRAVERWLPLLTQGLEGRVPGTAAIAGAVLSLALPAVTVLAGIGALAAVAQGSVTVAVRKLALDPSKVLGGLGRLVDGARVWGATRGLLALVIVGAALIPVLRRALGAAVRSADPLGLLLATGQRVVLVGGGCLAALAVVDVLVSRRLWLGRLRMTRDEVTREHKESEGDAEIRQRREELHHELLASEAVSAVRTATVVVVNPTHLACALRYDGADDAEAPVLVAKGHGALAARIVAAARAHGVPVVQDVPVARALISLELGAEIPEALYQAVAEVLAMASGDDGSTPDRA